MWDTGIRNIKDVAKGMNRDMAAIIGDDGFESPEWVAKYEQISGFLYGLKLAYESMNIHFMYDMDEWGYIISLSIDGLKII